MHHERLRVRGYQQHGAAVEEVRTVSGGISISSRARRSPNAADALRVHRHAYLRPGAVLLGDRRPQQGQGCA